MSSGWLWPLAVGSHIPGPQTTDSEKTKKTKKGAARAKNRKEKRFLVGGLCFFLPCVYSAKYEDDGVEVEENLTASPGAGGG
jgi:hypothetical protein